MKNRLRWSWVTAILIITCLVLGIELRRISARDGASSPEGRGAKEETAGLDDWPAFKHDSARSGVTSARVSLPLKLLWSYAGRPASPAWAEPGRAQNMLDFDYAAQPASAGGLVFIASSTDDTLRALDISDGSVVWSFTADAPIRFAPHLVDGRCFFAADDGYAYCLEARTGKEVWRFRAALNDRRLLAQGRMASRWPCRSGVLVQDGVVYLTAGMWPSEGVYIYALDARSGRPLWCNDTSCYDYIEYPHQPSTSFGGPAPQGYLLLANQTLVVPTGRGAPAGFDARSGKLHYFWANSPNRGGTWATLAQEHIFVSAVAWQPDQVVRLGESRPHIADSVAALDLRTGKEEWAFSKAVKELTDEGKLGRWRSQIAHGIYGRQRVLFQGKRLYALGSDKADAFEMTGEKTVRRLWSVPCPRAYGEALAGNALLIGCQDRLRVLDPDTGKTLADIAVAGQVRGLAVARGKVFVSTDQGNLYAFGEGAASSTARDRPAPGKRPEPSPFRGMMKPHLAALDRGYVVVAGAPDTRLAQEIAEATRLHVLCLFSDEQQVLRERRRLLEETTLYGSRVQVLSIADRQPLPFVSFFANLVVIAGKDPGVSPSEMYRVLRPCGGRMLFHPDADRETIVKEAAIPRDEVRSEAGQTFVVRGKLPGAFDWNSKVEADERVRWPVEFQWFGDPNCQLLVSRHRRPRTPIPANGRLFTFGESHLTATDAYNGTELWRRRLSAAVCTGQQPVAANDDFLFIQDGGVTWQLEAQSGRMVKAFGKTSGPPVHSLKQPLRVTSAGKQGEAGAMEIEQDRDEIRIRLTTQSPQPALDDRWELAFDFRTPADRLRAPGAGTFELVVDPWAGTLIPHRTFDHPRLEMRLLREEAGKGRSVVLGVPKEGLRKWLGHEPASFSLAADLKLWTDDLRLRLWGRPLVRDGKRTWLQESEAVLVLSEEAAPRAKEGEISRLMPLPLAAAEDLPTFASRSGRLPPMTRSRADGDFSADFKDGLGKESGDGRESKLKRVPGWELLQRQHPLTGDDVSRDYSRSYGCSGTSCSAAMDFFRSGTIGMYDRDEDAGMRNVSGIRSGCGQTLVPAFGLLLYSESASDCLCSYSFATSLALAPAPARRNEDWSLFDDHALTPGLIRRTALNLGAAGDRRDADGLLWLGFPRPTLGIARQTALPLPYTIDVAKGFGTFRINTDRQPIANTDRPWLYGSGIKGLTRLQMDLVHHRPSRVLLSLAPGQAPKIDGKLDDRCWDGFGALPLPARDAHVFLRHDEENLYVAYEQKAIIDRRGKATPWKASMKQKDGAFEKDDHFRITLFNPEGSRVVTMAATAGGGTYDALLDLGKGGTLKSKQRIPEEDATWDGAWTAKTSATDEAFRVEMAIPWKVLTDAGLRREKLYIECSRRSRWGGARDATLAKLLESGIEIHALPKPPAGRTFVVRLHFAELEDVKENERVFDVELQGKVVLKDFDVLGTAGGRFRAVVREFRDIAADKHLDLRLIPKAKALTERNAPILNAVEVHVQ